ncbi:MAG TPA: hypothetical protein VJ577_11420 [Burkholderiaceae bacterium]|nr:hypothetical protein [Burkholderiaceae bacterium]
MRRPVYNLPDALRPATAHSPVSETRRYNADGAGDAQRAANYQPRFDPRTLTPLREVAREDLSYVADTMRYGDFSHIQINVGANGLSEPILTRPSTKRTFLMIQNTHAGNSLYIGFGSQPSATLGIAIAPGGSLLLDAVVAQNDVYVSGSGAGTTGLLTYCNQAFGQA